MSKIAIALMLVALIVVASAAPFAGDDEEISSRVKRHWGWGGNYGGWGNGWGNGYGYNRGYGGWGNMGYGGWGNRGYGGYWG